MPLSLVLEVNWKARGKGELKKSLEKGGGWYLSDTTDCRAVVDWMRFKPGLFGALSSLFPLY